MNLSAQARRYVCVKCAALREYVLGDPAYRNMLYAPHNCAACGGRLVREKNGQPHRYDQQKRRTRRV